MDMKSTPFHAWRLALLPGLALAVAMPSVRAATRYVSPAGTHTPPYESWETAATNIQAALDVGSPGDVVVITNGIWLLEATVRVTNEVTLTSLNGRDSTVLDASSLPAGSDGVFLQFGTLDGLTISNAPRHGVKSEYGAIYNSRISHSSQTGIDSYTTPRFVTNSTLLVTNTVVEKSGSNGIYTCAVDTRILGCLITGSDGTGVSLRQNDTVSPIQVPRVSNFLIRASTVSSNLNSGIALAFYFRRSPPGSRSGGRLPDRGQCRHPGGRGFRRRRQYHRAGLGRAHHPLRHPAEHRSPWRRRLFSAQPLALHRRVPH